MPFINEGDEPVKTIESIYQTASPNDFEIIIIDDCSVDYADGERFNRFKEVIYMRNNEQLGHQVCKTMAAQLAKSQQLFMIDAHMRFRNDNWLNTIVENLIREPHTIFCTTTVALSPDDTEISDSKSRGYGAELQFFTKNNAFKPKFLVEERGDCYEVPCIYGATYCFDKDWFFCLRGFDGLKIWGSTEAYISLKSWFAGGSVKVITPIEIGHIYRKTTPFFNNVNHVLHNQIFVALTVMPELANSILYYLSQFYEMKEALTMIDYDLVCQLKKFYNLLFVRSFDEIRQKLFPVEGSEIVYNELDKVPGLFKSLIESYKQLNLSELLQLGEINKATKGIKFTALYYREQLQNKELRLHYNWLISDAFDDITNSGYVRRLVIEIETKNNAQVSFTNSKKIASSNNFEEVVIHSGELLRVINYWQWLKNVKVIYYSIGGELSVCEITHKNRMYVAEVRLSSKILLTYFQKLFIEKKTLKSTMQTLLNELSIPHEASAALEKNIVSFYQQFEFLEF